MREMIKTLLQLFNDCLLYNLNTNINILALIDFLQSKIAGMFGPWYYGFRPQVYHIS